MSNVDSQSSASGGIIIQVLGEMSNKGGPWRKFAQTFFLAEQPNGYFVLNDIFRYLKEDDDEAEEVNEAVQEEIQQAEAEQVEVPHDAELTDVASVSAVPAIPAAASSDVPPAAATPTPPAAAPAQAPTAAAPAVEDAVETAKANGILKHEEPSEATVDQVGVDKKVTATEQRPAAPAGVAAAEAPQPATGPTAASPSPAAASPSATDAQPEEIAAKQPADPPVLAQSGTAPAAAPAAPAAPKTWANLAASNATKWGSNVAAEARGVSSARAASNPQPRAGGPAAPAPAATGATGRPNQSSASPAAAAALSQNHGHVFIKNVTAENVPGETLREALTARFGPLKECQVIPSKACAFAEFASVEAARRAILASLPVREGGEGGVPVGKDGWTVTVEEKRKVRGASHQLKFLTCTDFHPVPPLHLTKPGDRPTSSTRGGSRGAGSDRGGFRSGRGTRGGSTPNAGRGRGAAAATTGSK